MQPASPLNSTNYAKGFLVDEEVIGGVTEMDGSIFSAYVSHQTTGETFDYKEFTALESALAYLNSLPRQWRYEAIGCGSHSSSAKTSGCGSCGSGGGCH